MTLLQISLAPKTNCLVNFSPSTTPQLPSVTKRGVTYSANVEVKKYYLLEGIAEFGSCAIEERIKSEETHGMVLIEIEALATVDGNTTSRILRRTLQRP